MNHILQYSSSRAEVWRAYWRAWARPQGLWIYHVLIGLGLAFLIGSPERFDPGRFAIRWVMATIACMALLPLWPQIRFKKAVRRVTLDAIGYRTTIGRLSGSRSWREVERIEDTGTEILIVGKNGNAMVVPQRAFSSPEERSAVLRNIQLWHKSQAV